LITRLTVRLIKLYKYIILPIREQKNFLKTLLCLDKCLNIVVAVTGMNDTYNQFNNPHIII